MTTSASSLSNHTVKSLKRPGNLDLQNDQSKRPRPVLLTTPDVNMLQLSSPELEKFILSHYNKVNASSNTPTPTQIICPTSSVSEEQDAYTRGFLDALKRLQEAKASPSPSGLLLSGNIGSILTSPTAMLSPMPALFSPPFSTQQPFTFKKEELHVVPNENPSMPTTSSSTASNKVLQSSVAQQLSNLLNSHIQQQPKLPVFMPEQRQRNADSSGLAAGEIEVKSEAVDSSIDTKSFPFIIPKVPPPPAPPTNQTASSIAFQMQAPAAPARAAEVSNAQRVITFPAVSTHRASPAPSVLNINNNKATVVQAQPMPMEPIDMDEVEYSKLERKRERNRIAARNCRNRKLARIETLEKQVSEMKCVNKNLSDVIDELTAEIDSLKSRVQLHINDGCKIAFVATS